MKSAEFTDFTSAQAFLAAGRKKGERSTADGWNTVLYERGGTLVLELHGTAIVAYQPSGETHISIPMRNHVVADRIQRYGFGDRFQLTTAGGKWSLAQAWGKMAGLVEDPTIWLPIVTEIPTDLVIDAAGMLTVPVAPPMPATLTPSMRAQVWDPAIKKWLGTAMKKLDAGWTFVREEWKLCPQCDAVEQPGQQMLGWHASHTHLLSHVLEGVVLPSTVVGLMAASSASTRVLNLAVDGAGNGTMGDASNSYYGHDTTRRYLKSMLRAAVR